MWEQVHTYFSGVGTSQYHILGGLFGYGISKQIKSAYSYLCRNYRDERDEIWLIGFSRGAYAARSLTGMIYHVGLLPQTELSRVEQAYQMYRDQGTRECYDEMNPDVFRERNHCQMPSIHFLGCFDTVGALGVPKLPWYFGGPIFYNLFHGLHRFQDTYLSPIVKHAYHAISIHDQRAWFSPTLMQYSEKSEFPWKQTLEQMWFPGMHTDVGGQEVAKYSRNAISYHSLRWMMSKASKLDLVFQQDVLEQMSNTDSCEHFYQDSYRSAIIYRIMPREDRVIEKDMNSQNYDPTLQLYNGGDFSSFISKDEMNRYRSKTLTTFYKKCKLQ
ncbi:hypothetical protein CU098_007543 [Rhizopus stolonifer]|uniref:T6SS Phospholipase effector Tle1-like catalytic domain-containing protein n=1 Tax=Rhizopus stolonifer TaxID=4846 RepID=A0A367J9G9_RHIST|nr:hypothetical protein CU098_007543 [Rhizopus stolonifer]